MESELGVAPEALVVLQLMILVEEQCRSIQKSKIVDWAVKTQVELLMAARAVYGIGAGAAPTLIGQVGAHRRGDFLVPNN